MLDIKKDAERSKSGFHSQRAQGCSGGRRSKRFQNALAERPGIPKEEVASGWAVWELTKEGAGTARPYWMGGI